MSNYKCIVAKIEKVVPIANASKVQVAVVLGEYTIVSKDLKVGDVGLFFPGGTQLSHEFCRYNNLYRDKNKNSDPTKGGFFEDNRKVKCQKFLGVKSEAFFCGLESLLFVGENAHLDLNVGDSFETLNGWEICKKYVCEESIKTKGEQKQKKPKVRVVPFFKEHVDTEQFKHNLHKIRKGDVITIQSKRHGTSGRSSITLVTQPLNKFQQLVNKVKPVFREKKEYQHVIGTRRVVLGEGNKDGFHGSEQFRVDIAEVIHPHLSEGVTAYYEIFGWANGKPIMPAHDVTKLKDKKYTKKYGNNVVYSYGLQEGQIGYHIYRVTYTTHSGETVDLTQAQLKKWCADRDLECSLDVCEPFVYDGDQEKLKALVEELTERPDVLTEDYTDPRHISEGVIIRCDRGTNTLLFLESKSYAFRAMESNVEVLDIEDAS